MIYEFFAACWESKKKFIVSYDQFQIAPSLNLNLENENRINILGLAKFYVYENIKYFFKQLPFQKKTWATGNPFPSEKMMLFYHVFPECRLRRKRIIWTLYITGQISPPFGFRSDLIHFRVQVGFALLPGSGQIFSTSRFRSDLLYFRDQFISHLLPGPVHIFSSYGFRSDILYFRYQVRSHLLLDAGQISFTFRSRSNLLHFRVQVRFPLLPGSDQIFSTSGYSKKSSPLPGSVKNLLHFRVQVEYTLLLDSGQIFSISGLRWNPVYIRVQIRSPLHPVSGQNMDF